VIVMIAVKVPSSWGKKLASMVQVPWTGIAASAQLFVSKKLWGSSPANTRD